MQEKVNKKRIEMLSVNYLRNTLLLSERIDPQIADNDKEPSWDGSILLYKNSDLTKDDLIVIPVQVKGTYKEGAFDIDKMKFDVSKRDLINYKNHNGVLYLVVQIHDKDDCKIFYNDLFPTDINEILKEMGSQDTKRIEFTIYDMSTVSNIETVLLNFHKNRLKHSPSDFYIHDLKKFNKIIMQFDAFKDNFKDVFFQSRPIYGIINDFPEKQFPISRVELMSLSTNLKCNVSINDEIFYDEIIRTEHKDSVSIKIGGAVSIESKKDFSRDSGFQYIINLSGKFKQRYHDSRFVFSLIKNGYYELDGIRILLPINKGSVKDILIHIDNLDKIHLLYLALGINEDLDLDTLTDNDIKLLFLLIEYFINGKKDAIAIKDDGILNIKISNLSLKFVANKLSDKQVSLVNIFDTNIRTVSSFYYEDDTVEKHSFFLSLTREDFSSLSNININQIFNDIIACEETITEKFFSTVTLMMLEVIHAYDSTQNEELLELCVKLDTFMIENMGLDPIALVNHYQIIARKRILSRAELIEIAELKQNIISTGNSNDILFALCVLSGDKIEAEVYLSKLTEERADEVRSYPIYRLYKNLID